MARAILSSMYPGKQASELTQEQKQVVSALGQLAAQLSAGVTSGSVEGGIQGAVAGKNAVENNTLGNDEEELQREHGNRPVKIISIKPAQAGIVDDEGSIRSVGGKVILPVAIKDLPATTGKTGTSSESGKDAKVVEPYITTSPIAVSGTRAIDKAQSYESGLREKYGNVPYTERQYTTIISGKRVNGVADNVIIINGQRTAVEAKFVEDWGNSLRNPTSSVGSKPWSVAEQTKMLDQARKYSAAFEGGVIYHTNSPELADHYSKLFADAGVNKFKFIITPVE